MVSDPKDRAKSIELTVAPKAYFLELVQNALEKRQIQTFPLAQSYLADLLEYFVSSSNLFDEDLESGKKNHPFLAELYLKALNGTEGQKIDMLKRLGDTSLYISGFFGDSLQRKIIDVDYYVDMGGAAYKTLAKTIQEDTFSRLYMEYAERFNEFVEVLTFISQSSGMQSSSNLLRLYDRYMMTGSSLARDLLAESGVVPATALNYKQKQ